MISWLKPHRDLQNRYPKPCDPEVPMEQLKKGFRVRIEAPPSQSLDLPLREDGSLPVIYRILLFLAFAFSGLSLYLTIASFLG